LLGLLPIEAPTVCLAPACAHLFSTQTGACAATGARALTLGATSVPLAWMLAGDWLAPCVELCAGAAAPWSPASGAGAAVLWSAELLLQLLATHTGAFASAGACTSALGAALVPLAWTLGGD